MKLSTLIENLTKIYEEKGDIECVTSGELRVRNEDGDFVLDSNWRYEYENFNSLHIESVGEEYDKCVIYFDDFSD